MNRRTIATTAEAARIIHEVLAEDLDGALGNAAKVTA